MVDISDPVVWGTIVQTIVLSLTLVIYNFVVPTQNKATRDAAYQKVLDDYSYSMKMLVERPELNSIQVELARATRREELANRTPPNSFSSETMSCSSTEYFERIYALYQKKWIDRETWIQWEKFLTR